MTDQRTITVAELDAELGLEISEPEFIWSTLRTAKFLNFMFWVALIPALYFTFTGGWRSTLTWQLWLLIICVLRINGLVSIMPLTGFAALLYKILKQLRATSSNNQNGTLKS